MPPSHLPRSGLLGDSVPPSAAQFFFSMPCCFRLTPGGTRLFHYPSSSHPHSGKTNRNSIGDKGVALLAQFLQVNTSVEALSLGGNRLTDEAARSLADLLRSGRSSLKVLNLAGFTPKPVRYGGKSSRRFITSILSSCSATPLVKKCFLQRI